MEKIRASVPLPLKDVRITDRFWSDYINLVRNTVIPYQWEALNDRIPGAEPSHAVQNFRIAAGLEEGDFGGMVFQDSDVAKWLEAVGYSLQTRPDPDLEKTADWLIDIIEKAQQPDGYLDTYFIVKEPDKKWTNLQECHELYVAGHMIEAAVAYYAGTGKRKLLDVACRLADAIAEVFGPGPGRIRGYDGHQEIELALVKLYEATGDEKYLSLSSYFIDERGREPNFLTGEWKDTRNEYSFWTRGKAPAPDLEYHQAHKPVRNQEAAAGHAVRAVYMYTAMADLAREAGDKTLLDACKRLWNNIVCRQLYITGGIGSTCHGEAFTFDYDLPNDTVYAETCASIGLIFFAHRMLQLEPAGVYADVIETALYNTVLGAMSRDGKRFFYVNPLEVWPEASQKNPGKRHIRPIRQKWFGCACCPPNLARLIMSLNRYIYSFAGNTAYIHLFIGGEAEIELENGNITLRQEHSYPWDGVIKITIGSAPEKAVTLAVRIPGWCGKWSASVNNRDAVPALENGYAFFTGTWKDGDIIELRLEMNIRIMQSNPNVRANAGKIAILRGPLVYCLEEADNGANLSAVSIDPHAALTAVSDESSGENTVVIEGTAFRTGCEEEALYTSYSAQEKRMKFKAAPYFLWGNREPGEMLVWIRGK